MMFKPRTVNSVPNSVHNQSTHSVCNQSTRSVHDQLTSVHRTEIIELKNRQKELLKQIETEAKENTILKSDRAKLDAALSKYNGGNNKFSATREKHRTEMRQLSDDLRNNSKMCQKLDRKIRVTEEDLNKMKDLLRNYRQLNDKTKLEGAVTLAARLQQTKESIREKDLEIQYLRAEIESLALSQLEEIKSEKLQNQQTKKLVRDLRKELETAVTRLKEKSKEIDLKNLYRFRKTSSSVRPFPFESEKPHPRTFASQRNSDSVLSSRRKAELYAVDQQARWCRLQQSLLEACIAKTSSDEPK